MTDHLCHADACNVRVAPKLLMCGRHWSMVPKAIQDAIWRTYRAGQEDDKNPSDAYMAMHFLAVLAVALRENRPKSAIEHLWRCVTSYAGPKADHAVLARSAGYAWTPPDPSEDIPF